MGAGLGSTGPAGDAEGAPKDAVLHGTPRHRELTHPSRGPAPRSPGLAAARGQARPFATRSVTGAAPPGPRGLVRGAGVGGPRRRRDATRPPRPHQVTNIPPGRTRLQRKARSIPQPGAKPPSFPFLCWMICLLTHPEKHSPPLLSLWGNSGFQSV